MDERGGEEGIEREGRGVKREKEGRIKERDERCWEERGGRDRVFNLYLLICLFRMT